MDRMSFLSPKTCNSTLMLQEIDTTFKTEPRDYAAVFRYESASAVAQHRKNAVLYFDTMKLMPSPAITGEDMAKVTNTGDMDGEGWIQRLGARLS